MPWVHDSPVPGLRGYRDTLHGARVSLYDGALQGLDTDGGRWSLVCETHSTVLAVQTLRSAESWWGHPKDWCEGCRDS